MTWNVPPAQLPDDVAATLAGRNAAQLNLYRALANSPAIVRAWRDWLWGIRDGCEISRALREIMILRTAVRHQSQYEWHHHVSMALDAGVPEPILASIGVWRAEPSLGEDERLVLELADALCDGAVPQDLAERTVGRFGIGGFVELVVTGASYVMVPRVLDALGVPLEAAARSRFPLPSPE